MPPEAGALGGAMTLYSVDRRGVYMEGKELGLVPNGNASGEIEAHIHQCYPQGFSRHGMQYFRDVWNDISLENWRSGLLEQLLESTRLAYYADKPGRFQSMFAVASLDGALGFRERYGLPSNGIFEIRPQGVAHCGDMGLISVDMSFAATHYRMHLYWQGKTLDHEDHVPSWEYVLELPVLVGSRVA